MENITKELFIESIKMIQKQYEIDSECSKAFKKLLPNDYVSGYDNNNLYSQLIKILQILTKDDEQNSWIDYYIWELEFGKKYKDGHVILDNVHYELITPEDLYELLVKTRIDGK
jgi:transcription elongation factor GreA-like protein